MVDNGFVKIFRSLLTWEWYDDIKTKTLFIHLLLTANYEDKAWHGVLIRRGQRVCSYATLAEETTLSVKQVRTALNHLISTGEVAHSAYPKYGVITVNNYDKFQGAAVNAAVKGQSEGSQRAVKGQQPKKAKKAIRQEEYVPYSPQGDENQINENEQQAENLTVEMAGASGENPDIQPRGKTPVEHSMTLAERFEVFWKAYPKRIGKGAGERAFAKLKPDNALLETMLKAVEAAKQGRAWQEDNGKYIPNPATWLNQKRWEDEVEQVRPPSGKTGQYGRFKNSSIDMDELQWYADKGLL